MSRTRLAALLVVVFVFATFLTLADAQKSAKGTFALFKTSMGDFKVQLFPDKAPKTVDNFVGLATGTKEYTDPKSRKKMKGKFYNGVIFHRVIDGFMIQGGDPTGTGGGDPGYTFEDEKNDLTFSKPGMLAMANRGPDTNGCQFFVTVGTPTYLNGKHTIFGAVVEGYDVVEKISKVPTTGAPKNTPLTPVTINSIEIKTVK